MLLDKTKRYEIKSLKCERPCGKIDTSRLFLSKRECLTA